jgi:hypothetical protein
MIPLSRPVIHFAAACALLCGFAASQAHAGVDLITNGNFNTTTGAIGSQLTATSLTGWTNNPQGGGTGVGYNFLYNAATADVTADTAVPLWGSEGANNDGGTDAITASPYGGNFVGMDGAYEQGSLSQTLTSLTIGTKYYVSFWWAGAQQYNFTGVNTEQFAVSLLAGTTGLAGNANCSTGGVQCTGIVNNASHGFTGWNFSGFTFTASAATETLSFLAIGTPSGQPPFSLLSGVSLTVPEPASLIMLVGVGGMMLARPRRRQAV